MGEEAHLAHVARVVLPPRADLRLEEEALLFRGGLVFKAHRLLYHSTLGLRVIKKKKEALRIVSGLGRMVHASWVKV